MEQKLLTPRQQKTETTKNRILAAAVDLIEQYGYDALTIKNICEQAGISNGSFFHYFKTKDEMLTYYLVKERQDYLEQHGHQERTDDVRKVITDIYLAYVQYCEDTGLAFISNYYSTSNQALNNHNPDAKSDSVISYDDVVAEIELARENGMVDKSLTAEYIADEICIIIKGIIFNWCLTKGYRPMGESVERLLGIYFDGIVTEKYIAKYGRFAANT